MIPSFIDQELWADFIDGRQEMQKKNRVPFTEVAKKRIIAKLVRMHEEGHDCNQALEDAICNSWRSVFPPKTKTLSGHSIAAPSTFAQQDREAGWARWEEMTGQRHPGRDMGNPMTGQIIDMFGDSHVLAGPRH